MLVLLFCFICFVLQTGAGAGAGGGLAFLVWRSIVSCITWTFADINLLAVLGLFFLVCTSREDRGKFS